jgi:hypothetical protein
MKDDRTMQERYLAAAHAVQTGVALELARNPKSGEPKHLRVGVNMRACDHTGLVKLLIAKGVITEDEYVEAMADEAELEQQRYEQRLGAKLV